MNMFAPPTGLNPNPNFRSILSHFDGRSTLSMPAWAHLRSREACVLAAFGLSTCAAGLGLVRRPLDTGWSATQVSASKRMS
jgi:hypothetical protein